MDLGIQGKRALVTGAGRGLGREIALCLEREGVTIAAVARTEANLLSLLNKIAREDAEHLAIPIDLAADTGPGDLLATLDEADFGPIDIVVHNLGGTLDITDPFCSLEDWRSVMRLNLEVAVELNRELIPIMQTRGWGRVVHVASISAVENHGPIPYCASKAALVAYTRSLGRLLAPDGIAVTAVLPGAVFTEGGYWDRATKERPEHVERYLAERMAIGRFGRPEEIGEVVAFLCSEHASFCAGSAFPVDGGQGRSFFGG